MKNLLVAIVKFTVVLFFVSVSASVEATQQNPPVSIDKDVNAQLSRLIGVIESKSTTDIEQAEQLAEQAMLRLEQIRDNQALQESLKSRLLNIIAYLRLMRGDFQQPYKLLRQARDLAKAQNNKRELAESYRIEGFLLTRIGEYDQSLELFIKALELHREIQSDKIFDSLQSMSTLYMQMGDMQKFMEFGFKMLARKEAVKGSQEQALAFYTLGYAYYKTKEFDLARENLQQAVTIWQKHKVSFVSVGIKVLADLEFELGRYEKSLAILVESEKLAKESNFNLNPTSYLHSKAKIYVAMGDLDGALDFARQALTLARKLDDRASMRQAYLLLADIYEQQQKLSLAIDAQRQVIELNEKINSSAIASKLAFYQTRFELDQKQQQIEALRTQNELQIVQTAQQRQRVTLRGYVILSICVILFLLTIVTMRTYKMGRKLQRYANQLQYANRAKSEFLANMSHEIRTPMNAILGMSLLALRTTLTTQQQDYLSKISSSAKLLLQVINDILDFSKIEAGKLQIEQVEFSFDEVLQHVTNLTQEQAEQKNIELIFSIAENLPNRLCGDPLRLGQVLINLISNAIKFTPYGEVIVSCSYTTDEMGRHTMNISVKDTGIGMTREQQHHLFESFTQADTSTTREFGGTGLGLAISQQLVNMMGGRIYVTSEKDKGSTFSFSILVGNADENAPTPKLPLSLQGLSILVVDDNDNARLILKDILEQLGFLVDEVKNGEAAIEFMQTSQGQRSIDLIMMDWRMTGLNGFETAKYINALPELVKQPAIVMVTSYSKDEVMEASASSLVAGFITKPVTATALLECITKAMGVKILNAQQSVNYQQEDIAKVLVEQVKAIHGARVLLVEDNEFNAQVARELLQQAGMVVDWAVNGKEAVVLARENDRYDLVLMDIQMPVVDGYQATRTLRSFDEFIDLPIVAMTAHAMVGERENCERAGMNDYLTKPIEPLDLYQALVNWIQPRRVDDSSMSESQLDLTDKAHQDNQLPANMPGIDVKLGLKRTGNKSKLYIELAQTFYKQYHHSDKRFMQLISDEDYVGVNRLAHVMQAGAGSIGAERLRKDLIKVAELADKKHLRNEQLVDFYLHIRQVFDSVAMLVGIEHNRAKVPAKDDTTDVQPMDVEKVKQLLPILTDSLKSSDFIAVEHLQQLNGAMSGQFKALMDEINELIADYEFNRALDVLEILERAIDKQVSGEK